MEEEEADRLRMLEKSLPGILRSTQPVRPDHPKRSINHSKSFAPIPFRLGL